MSDTKYGTTYTVTVTFDHFEGEDLWRATTPAYPGVVELDDTVGRALALIGDTIENDPNYWKTLVSILLSVGSTAVIEPTKELEETIRSLQATILDLQDEIKDLTQEVDTAQEETWQAGYDEGREDGYDAGLDDSRN